MRLLYYWGELLIQRFSDGGLFEGFVKSLGYSAPFGGGDGKWGFFSWFLLAQLMFYVFYDLTKLFYLVFVVACIHTISIPFFETPLLLDLTIFGVIILLNRWTLMRSATPWTPCCFPERPRTRSGPYSPLCYTSVTCGLLTSATPMWMILPRW